jgi:hypothetical protein
MHQVVKALAIILAVAVGVKIAALLLESLIPLIVTLLFIALVCMVVFVGPRPDRRRRW